LLDWRDLEAVVKGRQIGGSHVFGAWGVLHGLFGEDCTYVSRAEKEALKLLDKAKRHCQVLESLGSTWAKVVRDRAFSITLASGAVLEATTSKAAGRGDSGNIVLDEMAYHDDQEKVWDAAMAVTTHGYKARVLSTPNGVGDLFHQLCSEIAHRNPDDPKGWLVKEITVDDAIAGGMKLDIELLWDKARHDPRVYDQLYRCKFLDGDLQYIPTELLNRALTDEPVDAYAQTFGGIDIGESRDRTVLLVLQGDARNGYQVKHCETHKKTDDVLLQKLIDEAFSGHGCTRVALDRTGMGTFPAAQARRAHGPKLEPVQFTSQSKEAMAGRLYQAFADGNLRLPRKLPNDGEADGIRDDIASIRRIVTAAGNIRFDAPRTSKGHADRAWALMLALHSCHGAVVKGAYSDMMSHAGKLSDQDPERHNPFVLAR
jgi:phage FluMu gp28-like protein